MRAKKEIRKVTKNEAGRGSEDCGKSATWPCRDILLEIRFTAEWTRAARNIRAQFIITRSANTHLAAT
jgi:hypothetical protein